MIVVKVELWPGGDAMRSEALGVIAIANKGVPERGDVSIPHFPGDQDYHVYQVELQDVRRGTTRGRRIGHWRRRGWRVLVKRAIEEVL